MVCCVLSPLCATQGRTSFAISTCIATTLSGSAFCAATARNHSTRVMLSGKIDRESSRQSGVLAVEVIGTRRKCAAGALARTVSILPSRGWISTAKVHIMFWHPVIVRTCSCVSHTHSHFQARRSNSAMNISVSTQRNSVPPLVPSAARTL